MSAPRDLTNNSVPSSGVIVALLVCAVSGGIVGFMVALALSRIFGPTCE